jgi:hypothetical protein
MFTDEGRSDRRVARSTQLVPLATYFYNEQMNNEEMDRECSRIGGERIQGGLW